MGRCLIIGNQTLGSDDLENAVRAALERGIDAFHVVTPMTQLEHEASEWTGGYLSDDERPRPSGEFGLMIEEQVNIRDAAQWRARRRLERVLEVLRSVGADATGELGHPDPLAATRTVLEREEPFDEIIISTLPPSLSRWLAMELPDRVAELTDAPVFTVTAGQ